MINPVYESDSALEIRRIYKASRERVFQAWTDPDQLKKWFAVSEGFKTPIAEVDLQVGSPYRIGMQPPGGDAVLIAGGVYQQISPPEKLVFTWRWETPDPNEPETLVTVEFYEQGDDTEVVLKHELFISVEQRNRHGDGWLGCLEQLDCFINSKY